MSQWYRERRKRIPAVDAAEKDRMARRALEYREQALALRGDTTSEDLFRLAEVQLEVGDRRSALGTAEEAMGLLSAEGRSVGELAPEAADAFLATGRLRQALEIAESTTPKFYSYAPDGRLIPHGADPLLAHLAVLGAMGADRARIHRTVEAIVHDWADREYGATEREAISRDRQVQVGAALAEDVDARASWFQGLDSLPTILAGFDESDPERVAEWLTRAEAEALGPPSRQFVLGLLARKAERYEASARHFQAVREAHLRADVFNVAWGMAALSLLYEAESREAMGQSAEASGLYSAFLQRWSEADPDLNGLLEVARAGLGRVEGQQRDPA
jgi:tetratricopeptide (TPR) repeat protein